MGGKNAEAEERSFVVITQCLRANWCANNAHLEEKAHCCPSGNIATDRRANKAMESTISCHAEANTHTPTHKRSIKILRPELHHKLKLISTKREAKAAEDGRFIARYRTVSMASRWHKLAAPALQTTLAQTQRGKHHVCQWHRRSRYSLSDSTRPQRPSVVIEAIDKSIAIWVREG